MAHGQDEYSTTLGADAVFKGHLQFEKGARILGKFEGEIESEGQLIVAEGASLLGDAKANTILLDGHVKGNLIAENKVQLNSSARLEGDLQASKLEIAEGAVLIGRVEVGMDNAALDRENRLNPPARTTSQGGNGKPKVAEVRARR